LGAFLSTQDNNKEEHMRKLLVRVLLALSVLVPGAALVNTGTAGATSSLGSAVPCGYTHPTAPNAVDYCLGWIHDPASVWSYRIEASHHAGYWGPNYDPGTWHVFVDRYVHSTGAWQEREVDMNIGDQNIPFFFTDGVSGIMNLYPGYQVRAAWDPWAASYMTCAGTVSKSTFMSRSGNGVWPYGYTNTNNTGSQCQNGSGFIANNVTVQNNVATLISGYSFTASKLLFP
jgi:hypothetical protein